MNIAKFSSRIEHHDSYMLVASKEWMSKTDQRENSTITDTCKIKQTLSREIFIRGGTETSIWEGN